jgi:hypothetical protein
VNNNLTDYWDSDNPYKQASIPGAQEIVGSCDISLDGGGYTNFKEVLDRTAITSIAINTGIDNWDTFTVNTVYFDNTSNDISTGGDGMMTSQPFTGYSLTIA